MNKKKEEQQKELGAMWHQMLSFDQNLNLEQLFPNFVCLSVNDINVIDLVEKNPQVILKDISTILNLPKSTLTHIINRLEKKGYLNRTIAKQDLRSYGIELTEKGIQAQKEHTEYERLVFGKVMGCLEEEDCEQLIRILKKIIGAFQ